MTAASNGPAAAAVPRVATAALLALLAPAALVAAWLALGTADRLWLLGRLLYWSVPVLLAAAAGCGAWVLRDARWRPRPWLATNAAVLLAAAALTAATVALVPAERRVQWDETDLLSTARSMHEHRVAFVLTQAGVADGAQLPFEYMVDKRPPLFPFLVSVLHDVRGHDLANAFDVNAAVLLLLLATAGVAVRRRLGVRAGVAAQALLAAVPIAVAGARSAGFELLAAWLLLACVLAADALRSVPSPARLCWLLALGALFANARYESLAMFAVIVATLACCRPRLPWRALADRRVRAALIAFPVAVAPVLLQLANAQAPDFWSESSGGARGSPAHCARHLPGFVAAFFAVGAAAPFAGACAAIAAFAAGAALARRRWTATWTLLAVPVLATAVLGLCWFYGDAAEPSAWRFWLPAALLAALGPVALHAAAPRALPATALLAVAAVVLALRGAAIVRGDPMPRLEAARVAAAVEALLPRLDAFRGEALVVSSVAQLLALHGHGAVSPAGFERYAASIGPLLADGQVREVFVVTTPVDELQAPRFGSVRELLGRTRAEEFARAPGDVPVVVYRRTRRPF